MFDVAADPAEIAGARWVRSLKGARLADCCRVRTMVLSWQCAPSLGQRVTVKGSTLATRFVDAFGEPVTSPFSTLTRAFPKPARVAALTRDDIGRLGIVGARAETMVAIALRGVRRPTLTGEAVMTRADHRGALRNQGIGPWTAHYIAMRARWPGPTPGRRRMWRCSTP